MVIPCGDVEGKARRDSGHVQGAPTELRRSMLELDGLDRVRAVCIVLRWGKVRLATACRAREL
jgi:hypothetical protein